jgi:trk system potassium uptake protein TrkA
VKVLIVGCGRIGARVGETMWRQGHDVVVLDSEEGNFLLLPKEMRAQEGTTFVGDGALDADLVEAGIREADVFVAVAVRDNGNALSAQKAKHIFHVPQVVCRVGDPVRQEMYSLLGLGAVSPTKVTADLILEAVKL